MLYNVEEWLTNILIQRAIDIASEKIHSGDSCMVPQCGRSISLECWNYLPSGSFVRESFPQTRLWGCYGFLSGSEFLAILELQREHSVTAQRHYSSVDVCTTYVLSSVITAIVTRIPFSNLANSYPNFITKKGSHHRAFPEFMLKIGSEGVQSSLYRKARFILHCSTSMHMIQRIGNPEVHKETEWWECRSIPDLRAQIDVRPISMTGKHDRKTRAFNYM